MPHRLSLISLLLTVLLSTCQPADPLRNAPEQKTLPVPAAPTPSPAIPTPGPTRTPFQPLPPTPLPSATPTTLPSPTAPPTAIPEITLLFTGVIVPARCVQAAIDARGSADYIYDEVGELINRADIAVGTLNATLSDYPPHTGCVFTYILVGGAQNADALQRAGFDMMSVATNHIKNCGPGDCGDRAFFDTLDNLRRAGIQPVGAGKNLAEALQPVVVAVKGVSFGFVSLGLIEPQAFAGEDTPGIAVLDEANLQAAIASARQVSDVVIAMPHVGPEDSPYATEYQQRFAQVAVEAGVDLVVGNHTHVVQAIQEIDGVPVFYGLGNFVFDQTWDLAHQQGVILIVKFQGAHLAGYELIPTHVDGDGTVHLAGEEEAAQVLERIRQASEKLR